MINKIPVDLPQHATNQRSGAAAETEEARFLRSYDADEFDRPSLAVDTILLSAFAGSLWTLLVRRTAPPFRDHWALPGGFVATDESLEETAARVLETKAGLANLFLEQLFTFGSPARDPRTRVVSVAYYALVDRGRFDRLDAGGTQRTVARLVIPWEGETGGTVEVVVDGEGSLPLAFDHGQMLGMAVKRLRGKLDYTPIGFQLLPDRFTLRELQAVHETIRGAPVNKDSFRRRMLTSGLLEATGEHERDVEHRPAELYRFRHRSAI